MELRSCSNLHFIQAMKGGLVIKTCNIDSLGRPGLVFKKLKDIYEASKLALDFDGVKIESPCVPLVERKTRERGYGNNAKDSDLDDLNFGKMTLKQLKERCKAKKRKASDVVWSSPKQECTHLEPEEDEFDLMEPLSSLKSKLSKSPKTKKKCQGRNLSSKIVQSIKSEQILGDEDPLQATSDFPAPIAVKAEDPGPKYSESQIRTCVMDGSSGCIEQVGLCGAESGEVIKAYNCELENGESIFFTEQCESCVVNALSYDHLEHVEHESLPSPIHGETMAVDNQEKMGQELPVLHAPRFKEEGYMKDPSFHESFKEVVLPVKDQQSYTCNISQSCSDSEVQVSSASIDNGPCRRGDLLENLPPNVDNCSLSSPFSNCSSSLNSNPPLSSDNSLVSEDDSSLTEEKQPSVFTIADAARNCLNPDNNFVVAGDDSPKNEDTQSLSSHGANAEKSFSSGNYHSCNVLDDLSTSEVWQPPERLPSTRKVILLCSKWISLCFNRVESLIIKCFHFSGDFSNITGKAMFGYEVCGGV